MQAIKIVSERSAIEIHGEAVAVAKDFKNDYLRMFDVLMEVESRQIYYDFDVTSLQMYCIELLELSKHVANDFISVVRRSLQIPELAYAVRSRKVTISKVRKVCSVINESNFKEWIELVVHCSSREVERTVAAANPKATVQESMKFVSGDALELRVGVSEEWSELLTRTKDLISQKQRRSVSTEEALFVLMSDFVRKNDPVETAKRAQSRSARKTTNKSAKAENRASSRTRYRPASVEHQVDLRDGARCTFVDLNGKRCESRRWLEKHHVVDFAAGGRHEVDNLATLCSGHHKILHQRQERERVSVVT
ncbi:MAG: HNH endonuclease signature motif containing protein [Bdellovibrionota bacterium]